MATAKPGVLSKKQLKKIVGPVILSQGNKFIKELLRSHKISIGSTKADFSANLSSAIETGLLTQDIIEGWLAEVDGWGDQHIYFYRPPALSFGEVTKKIDASKYRQLLQTHISYEFPEKLKFVSINLSNPVVSMAWHIGNSGWVRETNKDFQRDEDGDRYEYRAHRERLDRNVIRFEWDTTKKYCAIFTQLPNDGSLHSDITAKVSATLMEMGVISASLKKVGLSKAFKELSRTRMSSVQSARMMTEGGHVDLVSTLREGGIADVEAVREVRRAVDDKKFASADGVFSFDGSSLSGVSRTLKFQGYGIESRVRIWVQCKRDDVYLLTDLIWASNR